MSKFKKKKGGELPPVSTASLPDIVFMLLFFFMTVTVMKDTALKVENTLPNASEIKKLEKKDRVVTIYIGKPTAKYVERLGDESKIQLNDKFVSVKEIGDYVSLEIAKMPEHLRAFTTISLKVDKNANMGLVSDLKQELRQINALKINYTTYEGNAFLNLE